MLRRMILPHQRHRQVLFYVVVTFLFVFIFTIRNNVTELNKSQQLSDSDQPNKTLNEMDSSLVTIYPVSEHDKLSLSWDSSGPSHKFWPGDGECGQFVTQFVRKHSLPTRALVSYPGSGNTWIRYLIESSTGVFTGSIFNDRSILTAGHLGEARHFQDGSTILQKTHHNSLYVSSYKVDIKIYSCQPKLS